MIDIDYDHYQWAARCDARDQPPRSFDDYREAAKLILALDEENMGLRDALDMARRRVDALADQMLAGKTDGGLLGGRQLKRAVLGIFGDAQEQPEPLEMTRPGDVEHEI